MHGLTVVKSLLARVFLVAHGLVCAWRVVDTSENQYCWVILVGLGFLLIEAAIVVWLRHGREFRTVAFCIIFYLTCTTPSLWIIHVDTANRKLYRLAENKLNLPSTSPPTQIRHQHHRFASDTNVFYASTAFQSVLPTTTPLILSVGQIDCNDKAWYYMEEQRWLDAIQETMLLVLSVSRLLIAREHLTIEKSGIVLIVSLLNAADLLSLSHALQYHDVIIERFWMYIGLILLTIGLFQMAFIDTDGLAPMLNYYPKRVIRQLHIVQDQHLCPLFRALFIHDGLLFIYRSLLAAKVRCSKPSIVFFMLKNLLMIAFHCYRVYNIAQVHERRRVFTSYEHLINTPMSSRNEHRRSVRYERERSSRKEQKLLHRTIRQPSCVIPRRLVKTPRTLFNSSPQSISYPFARRRNDGGRARTAFALYGLPFRTQHIPRPASISSDASLLAKAFVH